VLGFCVVTELRNVIDMCVISLFVREITSHVIQSYADEMKSGQGDQDVEDRPMEIG
jgi:hypothetical protein